MNWLELQKRIELMTPEEKLKPVLTFDENEGRFCEVLGVEMWDDVDRPKIHGTLYLDEDSVWFDEDKL
jgi:hypothetical protein